MKSPICYRDGLGIWLTKAKMITLDKTIYSENFFNPHRIHDHPRYPLFLPILESAYFILAGIDEAAVKIIFIYVWILILGLLYEATNRKSLTASLISLIIFMLIPAYYTMLDGSLDTGYADVPLSLFYLAAFIFLNNYLVSQDKKTLIGMGLCLAFSMFTKNEGFAFALSVVIIFVFIKKAEKDILILILATILPILPWLITMLHLPHLYAEHYLSYVPEFYKYLHRIPTILKVALLEIINLKHWTLFWPLILFIFIYLRPKRLLNYLLFSIMITVVLYLGILLITPWDVELQMKIVFPRMLLHITPLMTFIAIHNYLASKKL
jgi:hypothetical protein